MEEIELEIKDSNVKQGEKIIKKNLINLRDVQSAEVNLKDDRVKINYDNSKLDIRVLKGAIQEAGYKVK